MLETINRINNADFSKGAKKPCAWTWQASAEAEWEFTGAEANGNSAGMTIRCPRPDGRAAWSQQFRCKAKQHYRIEALVSCECTAEPASKSTGGLVLSILEIDKQNRKRCTRSLPPVARAKKLTLRGYYLAPPKTRSIELAIGLVGARGWATIHQVRVLPVFEPELRSYPLAVPPPPYANAAPKKVAKLCIVTAEPDRRLVELLRLRYGPRAVTVCAPEDFDTEGITADAVILCDDTAPKHVRGMKFLKLLADERIVIASPHCFEAICRRKVTVRSVKQIDDPLNALVARSCFVTQAFALQDIFPFAGRDADSTKMVQPQFRTGPDFKAFCKRHDLHVVLKSMADADTTSEKPIALLRETDRGALIVMDLAPIEADSSAMDEPTIAMHLLLAALGARQQTVGQYVEPARKPKELRGHLIDLVERFEALSFHGGRAPDDLADPCMITVGRSLPSVGLPLAPRPMILLRSGLTGDDIEGVYAVMLWLKHMLRPAPFASVYARALASKFRIAWLPLSASYGVWGGWASNGSAQAFDFDAEFEAGAVAACIDVTCHRNHSIAVTTAAQNSFSEVLAEALPALSTALLANRHFYFAVPEGADPADRSAATWRTDDLTPEITHDPSQFKTQMHRAVAKAGGELLRIDLPTTGFEPAANSIWRTDWGAGLIELVTGLLLGCVVVNRDADALHLELPGVSTILRDKAVLHPLDKPSKNLPVSLDRQERIVIPTGHGIVAVR